MTFWANITQKFSPLFMTYLLGCFESASFNITTWSNDDRMFWACIGGVCHCCYFVITCERVK